MHDDRPIRSLLRPVATRLALSLVLVTGLGVSGLLWAEAAVQQLTTSVSPAVDAHQELLGDMGDLESAVQGWAQTGLMIELGPYEIARVDFAKHAASVTELTSRDPALAGLVAEEIARAEAWIDGYADPRIDRAGGQGRYYDPAGYSRGRYLFADFKAAHTRTARLLDTRSDELRQESRTRLVLTAIAMAVAALAGLTALRATNRRLVTELERPLTDLERVTQRLADNDTAARAVPAGPRELRSVAAALNELAAAHEQSAAVEAQLRRDQQQLDTAKDEFVSNVSHELRTPLTTISGYLEMVAEEFGGRVEGPHRMMLESTQRNVARLRSLIDDLLTLSHADHADHADGADRAGGPLVPEDPGPLLSDVVADLRLVAARRGIRLRLSDGRAAPSPVALDRVQLSRALANLVDNAVKYSHDHGVVEVGIDDDGDGVRVRVVDHGIGIPAGDLGRLGSRFFRASNAVDREVPGTGLGLRIAQAIVEGHAGVLHVSSEEGSGTEVSVWLPRATVSSRTFAGSGPARRHESA